MTKNLFCTRVPILQKQANNELSKYFSKMFSKRFLILKFIPVKANLN